MSRLIICVDGLGKDFLSKENTPFLYNFGKKKFISELETLFATTGLEYGFFSGKSPRETGVWLEFIKSDKSVFNNLFLEFFSFNKKLRTYLGAFLQLMNKRTWISGLYNLPRKELKHFDSVIKENIWKLDYFQKRSFSFYKWPFFVVKDNDKEKIKIVFKYESDKARLKRILNENKKEVYYTQLMGVDKTVHKYGKRSEKVKKVIRDIDNVIRFAIEDFLRKNSDGEVFIWSDHGFVDIKNYINLKKVLPKRKDYVYFIAGTTAHFWFENEKIKDKILKIVKSVKGLNVLDKDSAEKLEVPFLGKYGDLVVYVEKGIFLFPNFYQKSEKEKFVSMHSYPLDKELNGFLISNIKLPQKLKIIEVSKFL